MEKKEDINLVWEHIMLSLTIGVLQSELQKVEKEKGVIRSIAVRSTKLIIDLVTNDKSAIEKEFRNRRMRVWEGEKQGSSMVYKYQCGNKQDALYIDKELARSEVGTLIGRYMRMAEKVLIANNKIVHLQQ